LRRNTILALALLTAACGDDSSSDGETERDAGSSADGGDTESPALKQARVTTGVNADEGRKDLLTEAICQKGLQCNKVPEKDCLSFYDDEWGNLLANMASEACRDAELDRIACLLGPGCDVENTKACDSFAGPVHTFCDSDAGK
jgi:hypothetical protein